MDGAKTPELTRIAYSTKKASDFSTGNEIDILNGIQLIFDDGTKSPFVRAENDNFEFIKEIPVDSYRPIRFISMKVNGGVAYEGMRFFDENMLEIIDIEWGTGDFGKWIDVQEVPEGS